MKIVKFAIAIPGALIYLVFSGIIISAVIFNSVTATEENVPIIQALKLLLVAFLILFLSVIAMLWGLDRLNQWFYSFSFVSLPLGLLTLSLLNITSSFGTWLSFAIAIAISAALFLATKKRYEK